MRNNRLISLVLSIALTAAALSCGKRQDKNPGPSATSPEKSENTLPQQDVSIHQAALNGEQKVVEVLELLRAKTTSE
ncbi:MAG TPA: hypothetical protein VJ203_08420 [Bacteroidales bacterium]|nr:hypothetical protein [Bacteroidales bacterium]